MTVEIDPERGRETPVAKSPESEAEEKTVQESPEHPSLLPSWVRIGVGLLVLIVLVFLAYPSLRERLTPPDLAPANSSSPKEAAATLDPASDPAHYELANTHYQAERFGDAWLELRAVPEYAASAQSMPEIAQAEKAVQDDPTSKEAHYKLGTVWARAGLFPPAEIAFKRAIALDSQYVDAYVNLGVVYYQMGRLSDALAQYDAALAITPDDGDIHHNKGAVYVQQALLNQTPDEALLDKGVEQFQRALELNPNLPQAHFSLGVVYDLRGQRQEALAMFKRFQELDDGSDPQATEAAKTFVDKLSQ